MIVLFLTSGSAVRNERVAGVGLCNVELLRVQLRQLVAQIGSLAGKRGYQHRPALTASADAAVKSIERKST